MFYALGSIGSFADGARTRQKEQRVERAAIRDEFERWKANNPNATAMDFHAKVKQLGATTPGGSVALPDASSIQRMAAENLRRKQQEEADRARKLRVDNLNMASTQSAFLRDQIYSGVDVDEALRKTGMELSPENFALAKGIKANFDAEKEQAKIDREFSRSLQVLNAEQDYLKSRPFASSAEAQQAIAQRLGVGTHTSQAPNPSGATTQGASLSDNGVLRVQGAFDRMLPTLVENNKMKYAGPNGYETLKRDALQLATSGGSTLPPEQIIRALEGTNFMAQFNAQIDDLAFASQLDGKQPSELSITVGEGKNAMAIELAEIYKSQLNNGDALSSRRIPYNKLDEFQSIVAPYFEAVDGAAQMKALPPGTSMEEALGQIDDQLNAAGIYNQDQLARQRQRKIAEYGQVDSLDILLAGQKDQLDEAVADATKAMEEAGSAAGQQAILNEVAQRFDFFKGLIENDRIADIYANGGVYPLDILPTSQHAMFQKDTFYALFDDAMAELNQIAKTNEGQVSTSAEKEEAEAEGSRVDRATNVASESVSDNEVNAAIQALGGFGINQGLFAGLNTDENGNFYREPVPTSALSAALLQQDTKVKGAVVQAMASAFEAFEAQRGAGLQIARPTGRKGLFSNIAGFIEAEITNVQQAMSQFPGYNRAVEDATKQFQTTLEMTTGTSGLSSGQIDKLVSDFGTYIKQATRQRRVTTNAFDMTPRTPNVTQTNLLGQPAQPMTSEQMLQQSVPGAEFVIPN